jgi:poly(3-hydroxybutyrate) depolymerase
MRLTMVPSHHLFLLTATLCGCEAGDSKSETSGGTEDTSGGETGGPEPVAEPRPLATPSGACPDFGSGGLVEFESSGETRRATVIFPETSDSPPGMLTFLHGLMDPGSTPEPTEYMAEGLGLQRLANQENLIIMLPESKTMDLLGFRFFLWDLVTETDADLVLFDDLRACIAESHEVDLYRSSVWGFSGGALFTTVLVRERGDAFAAMIENSGGSDIAVPIWTTPGAAYGAPPNTLPALLVTGGDSDVWPNASLKLVDFVAATDNLQSQLVADGNPVVRCGHERGHTITPAELDLSVAWAAGHRIGETSTFAVADQGDNADWCTYIGP